MAIKHPIMGQLTLSRRQRAAATATGTDIVVTAGAGTGKTRTLVARYLSLLAHGVPLRGIVAITFTRKAAREMRNRVRLELSNYLAEAELTEGERSWWQSQYTALDAARIGTIHNLCTEILRAHPAEAQIDPRFEVADDGRSSLLQSQAVDAALAWAADHPDVVKLFSLLSERTLRETIDAMLHDRLAVPEAFSAFSNPSTPAAIRAHWQQVLRQRQETALARLLDHPQWQAHLATLQGHEATDPDDKLATHRQRVLTAVATAAEENATSDKLRHLAAIDEINLRGGRAKVWGGKEQVDQVKAALKGLRQLWRQQPAFVLSLNELDEQLAKAMPRLQALFWRAQEQYQRLKQERNALDFDDLEASAVELLRTDTAVRHTWQSVVDALLVDEFQDTNERQRTLIRLLCPQPGKLFIVGDAKQSIYRFRGADVSVFHLEREQIRQGGGTVKNLETSYRAHRGLLTGLNDLLRPVLGEANEVLPAWVAPFEPLSHFYEEAEEGLQAPHIELHLTVGSKGQGALDRAADALVERIVTLVNDSGLDFDNVAILCRASTSFGYYEDALDRADIPFLTVAGRGFYQRPEIRDLLNALQAIADPSDDLAVAGLLRSPACALSDAGLYRLSQVREAGRSLWQTLQTDVPFTGEDARHAPLAVDLIRSLHRQAGRTAVADVLKSFLDTTGYRAALRQAGQHRAARNVTKLLADAHNSQLVSVESFLEYVAGLRDSGSREGEARATADGAIQIMSVHAAKGLEFPLVVIGDATYQSRHGSRTLIDPDCGILLKLSDDDGREPAIFQLSQEREKSQDEAESDRLLYVAATRAEQKLLINGCMGLNQKTSRPSGLSGWLKQMAGPLGLNETSFDDYDEEGNRVLETSLQVADTPIALRLYEPNYQPNVTRMSPVATKTRAKPASLPPPLLAPITPLATAVADDGGQREGERVWHVISTSPTAPARVVGTLVHEALALWRFPEPEFERWLVARAREHGLAEKRQLQSAADQTKRLLDRFRRHDLYRQIASAERRLHKVPYTWEQNGHIERGFIDLLFLRDGQWTVVDFKTDRVRKGTDLEKWLHKKGYVAQIKRYGTAVTQLMGQKPRINLCLLNCAGRVILREVGDREVGDNDDG